MIRNVPGARPVSDRARTWAGETNRRAGRRRGRTARPRDGGRAAERAAGGHPLGHPAGRLPPNAGCPTGCPPLRIALNASTLLVSGARWPDSDVRRQPTSRNPGGLAPAPPQALNGFNAPGPAARSNPLTDDLRAPQRARVAGWVTAPLAGSGVAAAVRQVDGDLAVVARPRMSRQRLRLPEFYGRREAVERAGRAVGHAVVDAPGAGCGRGGSPCRPSQT